MRTDAFTPLSPDERDALKALCEEATPGPWEWEDWGVPGEADAPYSLVAPPQTRDGWRPDSMFPDLGNRLLKDEGEEVSEADRAFIAAARTALPRLLAETERLREIQDEIVQLRGLALELSQTLAKRCLTDANAEVGDSGEWPDDQEWDDLNGTSQSIMRRRGWTEAGLDETRVVALMCDQYGNYKEHDVGPLLAARQAGTAEGAT